MPGPGIIIPKPPGSSPDVSSFDASGALSMGVKGGASLVAPLISLYRNKVQRELAVEAFRQSVRDFAAGNLSTKVGNAWTMAADWLAQTKPRVAAHIRQNPILEVAPGQANMNWTPLITQSGPGVITLTESGANSILKDPGLAREYMGHEAMHAAQALGNRDISRLYEGAQRLVGYDENPFEITARTRGFASKMGKTSMGKPAKGTKRYTATDWMRGQINSTKDVMAKGNPRTNTDWEKDKQKATEVIANLENILKRRSGK